MKGLLILGVSLDCQISGIRKIQLLSILFARVWKHENHKVGQLDTTFLSISSFLINLEAEEKSNPQKEMNQNLVLTIHFFRFQNCF